MTLPGGATYRAGEKQRWTVTVSDPDSSRARGFQLTADGGTFSALSGTVVNAGSGRQYVNQASSAASYSFEWTPPSGTSAVTVWLAGVAARGTRQTNVYTTSVTLTAAADAAPPTFAASNPVVNAASLTAPIAPGSWVSIFGANLAPAGTARTWTGAEIVDGALPTSLEGTSVSIDGKAAAVQYVSPSQLNVQAPDDEARGPVTVEVATAAGRVSTTVELRAEAPAFFRYSQQGGRYAAAVHADGTLCAPVGLFGPGTSSRAAKPGDVLLLYGTGFGAVEPKAAALQVYSGAAPLANLPTLRIRIGGLAAAVQFGGLTGAGLYQFNVVVPEAADGDWLLEAEIAGQAAAGRAYISIAR